MNGKILVDIEVLGANVDAGDELNDLLGIIDPMWREDRWVQHINDRDLGVLYACVPSFSVDTVINAMRAVAEKYALDIKVSVDLCYDPD